jgi:inhibitor of KinA sporulation pathway (predicted exonuclease)
MPDMLDICGIKLEGRHHSGIDDAKNIASIVLSCLKKENSFTQGMVHSYK